MTTTTATMSWHESWCFVWKRILFFNWWRLTLIVREKRQMVQMYISEQKTLVFIPTVEFRGGFQSFSIHPWDWIPIPAREEKTFRRSLKYKSTCGVRCGLFSSLCRHQREEVSRSRMKHKTKSFSILKMSSLSSINWGCVFSFHKDLLHEISFISFSRLPLVPLHHTPFFLVCVFT